jgi:hypothetical protein
MHVVAFKVNSPINLLVLLTIIQSKTRVPGIDI